MLSQGFLQAELHAAPARCFLIVVLRTLSEGGQEGVILLHRELNGPPLLLPTSADIQNL